MDERTDDSSMEYTAYPCADDLSPFVHRHMHGAADSDNPRSLRIPPTGGIFLSYVAASPLLVHFSDRVYDHRPTYFIGGQLRREQPVLVSEGRFELIGTEFTPTGFYRLFRINASRYTDDIRDFAGDCPEHAAWLDKQLDDRTQVAEKIAIMEDLLRALAANAVETRRVDRTVRSIVARRGIVSVSKLAAEVELTPRQLHRRFVTVVGVSPKHYAKIVQINEVFSALVTGDFEHTRELALDHGYFDQAHFIRDFQRFVSMSPTQFLESDSTFLRTFLGRASRLAGL